MHREVKQQIRSHTASEGQDLDPNRWDLEPALLHTTSHDLSLI